MYLKILLQINEIVKEWMTINLETILITLIFGVIAGVISAITFYYLMKMIKPNIEISEHIARRQVDNNGKMEYEYVIKIINRTKSNVEDVSYQLFIMEDYFHGTGKNYSARELNFMGANSMKFLTGKDEKNESYHDNCRQIRIKGDLEGEWDEKKEWLQFQIVSYHSKSGSRKVHKRKYTNPSVTIKDGLFDSGETFEILSG